MRQGRTTVRLGNDIIDKICYELSERSINQALRQILGLPDPHRGPAYKYDVRHLREGERTFFKIEGKDHRSIVNSIRKQGKRYGRQYNTMKVDDKIFVGRSK